MGSVSAANAAWEKERQAVYGLWAPPGLPAGPADILDRTLDDYAHRVAKLVTRTGFLGRTANLDVNRMTDELTAMKRSVEGSFSGPLGEFVVWLERHLTETLPFDDLDALLDGARKGVYLPTPLPPVAERVSAGDTQDPFRLNLTAFLREPQASMGRRVRAQAAEMQHHAAAGDYLYFLDHSPHHDVRAKLAEGVEAERHLHWFAAQLGAKPSQHDESLLPRLEAWLYEHLVTAPLRELEALAAGPPPEPSLWARDHDGSDKPQSPSDDPLAERRRAVRAQIGDLRVEYEREIVRDGCRGTCIGLHHPYSFTGRGDVDDALSRFPIALFLPDRFGERRPAHQTPVVLGMAGIGAPYEWNGFVVPTLLEMGIAVVLLESPLAGQRGLVRSAPVWIGRELRPLVDRGVPFDPPFLARLMDGVSRDVRAVFGLLGEQHDLVDPRQALFGVSMGTLFTAFPFMRDGVGQRLLGVIGHGDLAAFCRSYFEPYASLAAGLFGHAIEGLARPWNDLARPLGAHDVTSLFPFARMLRHIADHPDEARDANPFTFVDRVSAGRPVRYLVGELDELCAPGDTRVVSAIVANGETEVVPGMGHDARIPETRAFLQRHLADWRG